jgi:hypothetical protein
VSLTDGELAVLAEQAASLVPPPVSVRIAPAPGDDPYRWGQRFWTVVFDVDEEGREGTSVTVPADDSPVAALERLVDGLGDLSETRRFWGQPFPRCRPGHRHPAVVAASSETDVVWSCPESGEEVLRLRPEA